MSDAYPHDDERCRQDSVDAAGFRDLCRALAQQPPDVVEGVLSLRPMISDAGGSAPPPPPETAEVYRGWIVHNDGSQSPFERWVKHANGSWVSLDSERSTNGDILVDPAAPRAAPTSPDTDEEQAHG